jgi:predicted transposase YdaD
LSYVSPEFEQKFKDMKYDFVTPAEKAAKAFETNYMAPRLREAHRKGIEEGIEKGLEKGRIEDLEKGIEKGRMEGIEKILSAYISHHLYLSDEAIAGQFNVSQELVQRLRAELSA